MKHIVIVLCLTFMLPSCTAVQATTGTVADIAPAAMLAAKKGLIAAHGLHEAAADALKAAATSNLCVNVCASKAKDALDQSEAYLIAADALVKLGDAPGIEAKISEATALISTIQALSIGKN